MMNYDSLFPRDRALLGGAIVFNGIDDIETIGPAAIGWLVCFIESHSNRYPLVTSQFYYIRRITRFFAISPSPNGFCHAERNPVPNDGGINRMEMNPVWIPTLKQVVPERLERVIGCGHVSGLSLRRLIWPQAGMEIRRSSSDHIRGLWGPYFSLVYFPLPFADPSYSGLPEGGGHHAVATESRQVFYLISVAQIPRIILFANAIATTIRVSRHSAGMQCLGHSCGPLPLGISSRRIFDAVPGICFPSVDCIVRRTRA
ncbi:hypothetical protein [Paenirhodobacter sp.]|uniref:hypothetical protein n=1 Tax=Paenirhodobacter sp. TaxID=1965326 RepID=UPI003B3D88A9